LQSVRRHSAIVVTGTVNDVHEIHPVKRLPCKLNRRWLVMISGDYAQY
jgi:hypothetical protein